jgi:hypothetical protein
MGVTRDVVIVNIALLGVASSSWVQVCDFFEAAVRVDCINMILQVFDANLWDFIHDASQFIINFIVPIQESAPSTSQCYLLLQRTA